MIGVEKKQLKLKEILVNDVGTTGVPTYKMSKSSISVRI